jgi:DNA-directed RNA polymerase subunit RPC12/RpoP
MSIIKIGKRRNSGDPQEDIMATVCYCPNCKKRIEITGFEGDEIERGKNIKCGRCGAPFVIKVTEGGKP